MAKTSGWVVVSAVLLATCLTFVGRFRAQAQSRTSPPSPDVAFTSAGSTSGAKAPYRPLDDEYLEWPLPATDKQYGAIDGRKLKKYDAEVVAIGERYRAQGHPQFWGRITGTSADAEMQQWVLNKYKQIGLSDVHTQEFNLPPQWQPKSWEISATGAGKTLQFPSAFPSMSCPGTPANGLDLEAVYVGTGSEADFVGRDVKGKAAFIYNNARNHAVYSALTDGAARRAEEKGAAAVFLIYAVPGNIKVYLYHLWPHGDHVPTFSIGLADGLAMRDLIERSPSGHPPHVKLKFDAPWVPGLKTATIWGTLPGMTDEKIYLSAHRDSIFDGAVDNASGVSSMIGLAEYFSKIPKEKRRRTIVFLAPAGHHNNCKGDPQHPEESGCSLSIQWLADHHEELFKKAALIINLEHLATTQTYSYMGLVRKSTTQQEANFWYVHGSPKMTDFVFNAYREFGVPVYVEEDTRSIGDGDPLAQFAPMVNLINLGTYSHTDQENLDDVPWTGLEGVTRAYAKIIDEVNRYEIKDLLPEQE